MRTGYAAMRFGWLAFVIPFMFVASPTLLMTGHPLLIILDLLTALAGTCLVCMAIVGYFVRPIGLLGRLIFAAAGLALISPTTGFKISLWLNLFGFIVGILIIGREVLWRSRVNLDKIQ